MTQHMIVRQYEAVLLAIFATLLHHRQSNNSGDNSKQNNGKYCEQKTNKCDNQDPLFATSYSNVLDGIPTLYDLASLNSLISSNGKHQVVFPKIHQRWFSIQCKKQSALSTSDFLSRRFISLRLPHSSTLGVRMTYFFINDIHFFQFVWIFKLEQLPRTQFRMWLCGRRQRTQKKAKILKFALRSTCKQTTMQ